MTSVIRYQSTCWCWWRYFTFSPVSSSHTRVGPCMPTGASRQSAAVPLTSCRSSRAGAVAHAHPAQMIAGSVITMPGMSAVQS